MRTAAALLLLVAVAAAQTAPPFPRAASEATHTGIFGGGWREEPDEKETREIDVEGLGPGPAAAAQRLLDRVFTVQAVLYRFEALPGPLAKLPLADRPVLDAGAQAAIRDAARAGDLRPVQVALLSGRVGDVLTDRAARRRHRPLRYEVESAQASVATGPRVAAVQEGAWFGAVFGPHPGRGVRLRYLFALTERPDMDPRPSLAGPIEFTSVPVLFAEGGIVLEPKETVALIFTGEDGRGALVTMRLTGTGERLDAVTDLGGGWVMALTRHLEEEPRPPVAWADGWEPTLEREGRWKRKDPPPAHWREAFTTAGARPDRWFSGPLGLKFGRPVPPVRERLRALLARAASRRGRPGILVVKRKAPGRILLPVSPGETFRVAAGRVDTVWAGTEVQAGCSVSVGAAPLTRWSQQGLSISGRVSRDGHVFVDLRERTVLRTEWRVFPVRRMVAGYRRFARDLLPAPLVTDRLFLYRGPAVPGGPIEYRGPGSASFVPGDRLDVGFAVVQVVPGLETETALVTRRDAVVQWDSEGWCGMTMRYPLTGCRPTWPEFRGGFSLPEQLWEGSWMRLTRAGDAGEAEGIRLTVEAEVRGAPEFIETFDPLDGEVDLVRQPRLCVESRDLDLLGGGRVAWGNGLEVTVRHGSKAPGFHRPNRVVVRHRSGEAGLLHGGEGRLEAGGVTVLPEAFPIYSSNHEAGEVTTGFVRVRDGVTLRAEEANGDLFRLSFGLRSRPTWEPHLVRIVNSPERPESDLRTLRVSRRRTDRTFLYEADRGLHYQTPTGSAEPFEISAEGAR